MSGRVVIQNDVPLNYELYEGEMKSHSFQNSLKGIQDCNILSGAFFSKRNIDNIHKLMQKEVLKRTNNLIGRQSDLQLQIIMRSIYLQYSKNLNCNYKEQIRELNKKVVDYSVDRIIVEIYQFLEYRKEVSKLPNPLSHPKNNSSAGNKSLNLFNPI